MGKVLKAVLVFKGMMIEWVVIRGYTEDSTRVDGQVMYYLLLFYSTHFNNNNAIN